jgi:hypothetical protein
MRAGLASSASWALCVLAACKGPQHPRVPDVTPVTVAVTRPGGALRGVAGDGERTYAAIATGTITHVEARRGNQLAWHVELPGRGGPLATARATIAVGLEGLADAQPAAIAALDRATGVTRWTVPMHATEWATITSLAALGDDVIVGGAFGGNLRIGARVVTSAGGSDGFVARLAVDGSPAWLIRVGGHGADAVQGVATAPDRIAIAGTFSAGADLLGVPLAPYDERSPLADAFVAELDPAGARRWVTTFGGKANETVAGVAIDRSGRIAVAASAREVVHVGSAHLVAQGAADGLVAWFGADGDHGAAVLIGGFDFDGVHAIAAVGDRVVIGGFFSGTTRLGDRTLTAGGGGDAFVAALDASGTVAASWHVGGAGREEIASLAAIPGGFVAGIAHTADLTIDDDATLPAPADPLSGAALIVRPLR